MLNTSYWSIVWSQICDFILYIHCGVWGYSALQFSENQSVFQIIRVMTFLLNIDMISLDLPPTTSHWKVIVAVKSYTKLWKSTSIGFWGKRYKCCYCETCSQTIPHSSPFLRVVCLPFPVMASLWHLFWPTLISHVHHLFNIAMLNIGSI